MNKIKRRTNDVLIFLESRRQRNGKLFGIRSAAGRVRADFVVTQQQVRWHQSVGREWRRHPTRFQQARMLPEDHHAPDVVSPVQQFAGNRVTRKKKTKNLNIRFEISSYTFTPFANMATRILNGKNSDLN